jgi:FkbM family methyltransferase
MIELLNHRLNAYDVDVLVNVQMERLRQKFKKRQLVGVHVGAYNGQMTRKFCAANRDTMVHAIEPCKRNFKILSAVANEVPNMTVHRLLIGQANGVGTLFVNVAKTAKEEMGSSQNNSMFKRFCQPKPSEISAPVEIKMCTLATFLRQLYLLKLDFLRLNCEGAEYLIFNEDQDVKFLKRTNIMAITVHGKNMIFLNSEHVKRRIKMAEMFKEAGLQLIYGCDFSQMEKLPVGHVWQIWTRERFI